MNELTENIEKLHTTALGEERIRRNLSLGSGNIVQWCKDRITEPCTAIERKGKNWYAHTADCVITVNAHSYTIITAHKKRDI